MGPLLIFSKGKFSYLIISITRSSVFAHRYKDVSADIRALTMESVFKWVIALPEQFLNDNCLKYFGWLLNDSEANIREIVVKGLHKLYSNEEWHGQLQKFTKKYLPRMVELTSDVSIDTAVDAIKLLTLLLRNNIITEGAAYNEYFEKITQLIFDANASVRHYASLFMYHRLTKQASASSTPRRSKKSKKKADIKIQDLLTFIRDISEEMPMAPAYIVEGFWEHTNALRNWQNMTDLIMNSDDMEEEEEEKQRLESEEDEINMIRILVASVQKATGNLAVKTTKLDTVKIHHADKKRKDKQEEENAAIVEEMSSHMASMLPQMLEKFQAEREKVIELVQIARYLNLNVFTEHRLQHVR